MSFWDTLRVGASGLVAQRTRLDTISNNIANAETTRTAEGGPYKRQDVIFQAKMNPSTTPEPIRKIQARFNSNYQENEVALGGVEIAQITTDQEEGALVYDPTHPDADENGYVRYPNVNLVVEMTNMISASRSYEANLSLIDTAKRMAQRALEIGR